MSWAMDWPAALVVLGSAGASALTHTHPVTGDGKPAAQVRSRLAASKLVATALRHMLCALFLALIVPAHLQQQSEDCCMSMRGCEVRRRVACKVLSPAVSAMPAESLHISDAAPEHLWAEECVSSYHT